MGDETQAVLDETPFTMDDLFQEEVNQSQIDDANKKLLPPAGTYITNPEQSPMSVTLVKNDAGRRIIVISGRGELRDGTAGPIRVRMSPDYVEKVAEGATEGKPDFMSKLYVAAVNAYKATFKDSPKTAGHVAEYLQNYPAAYRLVQVGVPTKANPEPTGEPGALVVNISAVRR